ncbi:uncharacterized protein LOC113305584 [Papaver somniferum]|uniref:uncharacterized protein LOC113305584 n=1 Tax=Papaver somniferum TaxID=3469 RepID=UPI000E6F5D71|nr:uncharacterized protein LOC113305584 [Papaver somniferum]
MALKLDLSKAFDRLELSFLLNIMKKSGFCDSFYNLINQCLSTTCMNILLNGSPCKNYHLSRGLRQEDPLSPYLFLSLLWNIFLDVFLLLNLIRLFVVLRLPEELILSITYSQLLNCQKSSVYFSNNMNPIDCDALASALNMNRVSKYDTYLGDPLLLGRNKGKAFSPIAQFCEARLNNWSNCPYARSAWLGISINVSNVLNDHTGILHWIISWFSAGECTGVKGKPVETSLILDHEAEQMECISMKYAVEWATSLKLERVIFESDNELLIKSIKDNTPYVHWINHSYILDIQSFFHNNPNWFCYSVLKDKNSVAYGIAKKTTTSNSIFGAL